MIFLCITPCCMNFLFRRFLRTQDRLLSSADSHIDAVLIENLLHDLFLFKYQKFVKCCSWITLCTKGLIVYEK